MTAIEQIKRSAAMKAYDFVDKDPDRNIPKLIYQFLELDDANAVSGMVSHIRDNFNDPNGNWRKLILSLWSDVDPGVRRHLFESFAVNAALIGNKKRHDCMEQYRCNIPWAILMDPTSACNLRCTGCWAAEYGHSLNLTLEELDDVIRQGEEFGCYVYLYSGGEPTVRRDDLIRLCEMHPECVFLAFTNATLIDEAFADEMLRVGNFVPAISVEGFEKDTDFRRGEGTYAKVKQAMELLRRKSCRLAFPAAIRAGMRSLSAARCISMR